MSTEAVKLKRNAVKSSGAKEDTPTQRHWTARLVQEYIGGWRNGSGRSVCAGFCKLFDTGECPYKGNLPSTGRCEKFRVNARSPEEMQALFIKDAAKFNIVLPVYRGH